MYDYLPMNVSRGSSGDNPRTLMMESSSDETRGCDIPDCIKTDTSGKCDERGHSFHSFFLSSSIDSDMSELFTSSKSLMSINHLELNHRSVEGW